MADFASIAAATAAGYKYNGWQGQDGFYAQLSKPTRGMAGEGDDDMTAESYGLTQAAADTNTLAALNAQRSARYGFQEPAVASLDDEGQPEVVDAT